MKHMDRALSRLAQMEGGEGHAPGDIPSHPGDTGGGPEEGAGNPFEGRAVELAESWINGNRSDVVSACRGNAALAVEVFEELAEMKGEGQVHSPDCQEFARQLRSVAPTHPEHDHDHLRAMGGRT